MRWLSDAAPPDVYAFAARLQSSRRGGTIHFSATARTQRLTPNLFAVVEGVSRATTTVYR